MVQNTIQGTHLPRCKQTELDQKTTSLEHLADELSVAKSGLIEKERFGLEQILIQRFYCILGMGRTLDCKLYWYP